MAIIDNKICTDLAQSNELMKFLPIESADMCYEFDFDLVFNTKWKSTPIILENNAKNSNI